jgi:hypothetical protein
MEYTDDRSAAVEDTNKSASEKHGFSAAIVDALDGAVTADHHRQEALTVLEPAVPFADLVEELPGPGGGAVELLRKLG